MNLVEKLKQLRASGKKIFISGFLPNGEFFYDIEIKFLEKDIKRLTGTFFQTDIVEYKENNEEEPSKIYIMRALMNDQQIDVEICNVPILDQKVPMTFPSITKITDGENVIFKNDSVKLDEEFKKALRIKMINDFFDYSMSSIEYYGKKHMKCDNPLEDERMRPFAIKLAIRMLLASMSSVDLEGLALNNIKIKNNENKKTESAIYVGPFTGEYTYGVIFTNKNKLILEDTEAIFNGNGEIIPNTSYKNISSNLAQSLFELDKKPRDILFETLEEVKKILGLEDKLDL